MTVYMLSLHFKTYIDEKENSGFCLAFTSLHAEIYFYRFLILFLLAKPHHTTTQAAKDWLKTSEKKWDLEKPAEFVECLGLIHW